MTSRNKLLVLKRSTQFKRDLKKAMKQGKDITLLEKVVTLLQQGAPLPPKYRDHFLGGHWCGYRECHLEPDWLLIYRINQKELYLYLTRVGSHAALFR